MDEDNEEKIREPQIKVPIKQIDEDIAIQFKKKKAELEKQKEESEKLQQNTNNSNIEEFDSNTNDSKEDMLEKAFSQQASPNLLHDKVEEQKNEYQAMLAKINREREERQARIEDAKIASSTKSINANGTFIKDIAYMIFVLAVIGGCALFLMGNFLYALLGLITCGFLGAICLGISEQIKIMQNLYDVVYYEKTGHINNGKNNN